MRADVGCRDFAIAHIILTVMFRESTTDAQRDGQEDDIIVMVRTSLVDDDANVRAAAAKAFDILQEHIGARAIDETIPTLLEALRQPGQSSGTALQALREVMSVSNVSALTLMFTHYGIRFGRRPCSLSFYPHSPPFRCQRSTRGLSHLSLL